VFGFWVWGWDLNPTNPTNQKKDRGGYNSHKQ